MSTKRDSTKVPEDDYTDSGLISGPLSGPLTPTEDIQTNIVCDSSTKVAYTESTQLDSGLDLTLSEDLSNIKLSDKELLDHDTGATLLEKTAPLVDITEDNNQDIPPLGILFQQDDDGDTQIHIAAVHGCQKSVSTLIHACPDRELLNVLNDYGQTALHLAVLSGHPVVARMLVLAGVSTNVRDLAGENPLHLASLSGQVECIKALLTPVKEHPERRQITALLNQKNYNGQMSVHLAAMAGHIEALQTLIFYGADINAREGLCGWTPLHIAVVRGDVGMVTYLARRCAGVAVRARDYAGRTARRLARDDVKPVLNALVILSSDTDDSDDESYDSDQGLFEEILALKSLTTVA